MAEWSGRRSGFVPGSPSINSLDALVNCQMVYILPVNGILNLFSSFDVFCCYLYGRSTSAHAFQLLTYSSNNALLLP